MVATIGDVAKPVIQFPKQHYLSREKYMPQLPPWPSYTVKEAAERTGYNEEYLRRLIRDKKIEAVKIGYMLLIRIESLENYIRQMEDSQDARTGPRLK